MNGHFKLPKIPTWRYETAKVVKAKPKPTAAKNDFPVSSTSMAWTAINPLSENPDPNQAAKDMETKIEGQTVQPKQTLRTYTRKKTNPIKIAEDMDAKVRDHMAKAKKTSRIYAEGNHFSCSRCKQRFMTSVGLKVHRKKCDNAHLFKCVFHPASAEETSKGFMVRQIGSSSEPKLICVNCGRKFTSMKNLINHRKLHENQVITNEDKPVKAEVSEELLNEEQDQTYYTTEVPLKILHDYLEEHRK